MGTVCNSQEESTQNRTRDSYRPKKLNLGMEADQASQDEILYRKKVDKIWKEFDTNNNNRLEKDEATKFLKEILPELIGEAPTDEMIERSFNIMDKNGSGDIDKEECFQFLVGFRIA